MIREKVPLKGQRLLEGKEAIPQRVLPVQFQFSFSVGS